MTLRRAFTGLLMMALAPTTLALAGGWTSGGGEILESGINPWFVQSGKTSKKIVRYCVVADEANFGVPIDDIRRHVRGAFDFWYDEFASAFLPEYTGGQKVYVAAESFFEVPCDSGESLRFQFGVLSTEQLQEFSRHNQDPTHYVALAVRTEYNEATLESKGFVYVSPPRGPLAMRAPDILSDPWSGNSQVRLAKILQHELGHVFGLTHSGDHADLMGAGFPEVLVKGSGTHWYPHTGYTIFRVPLGTALQMICYQDPIAGKRAEFLGISKPARCLGLRVQQGGIQILSREHPDARNEVVGSAAWNGQPVTNMDPKVRLWLPDIQRVFTGLNRAGMVLQGPMRIDRQYSAQYKNTAGTVERLMRVHLIPGKIQIDGVMEDKFLLDMLRVLY